MKPAMWLPFRIFVGLRRPRHAVLGLELSGEIEEVGARVTRFRPGDKIFAFTGRRFGAYGEYVCLRGGGQYMPTDCVMASKPATISLETRPSQNRLQIRYRIQTETKNLGHRPSSVTLIAFGPRFRKGFRVDSSYDVGNHRNHF